MIVRSCTLFALFLLMFGPFLSPVTGQSPAGPAKAVQTDVYRINCGGSQYIDPQGKTWVADFGFNTGNTFTTTNPIANTGKDPLYQVERWDPSPSPELVYSLAVTPSRQYKVKLHFAEIYSGITGPGQRLFDVAIDGVTKLTSFDQFAAAGGPDTAIVKTFTVMNVDGMLDISFTHVADNPAIKAIHVISTGVVMVEEPPTITSTPVISATENLVYNYDVDATDPNPGDVITYSLQTAPAGATIDPVSGLISWTPNGQTGLNTFSVRATDVGGSFDQQTFDVDTRYRINCGATVTYVASDGHKWAPDFGFNTGSPFSTSQNISGTPDPTLYQTERFDSGAALELVYSLNLPAGNYLVRLHFAEIYDQITAPGLRVFDVSLEGTPTLVDYDVFAQSGGLYKAIQEDLPVTVADGTLNIEFFHDAENPKISAIEVLLQGQLAALPSSLAWGHVDVGQIGATMNITLDNTGAVPVTTTTLTFRMLTGQAGHDFEVNLEGTLYVGDHGTISHPVNTTILPGQNLVVPVLFKPTEGGETILDLEFDGNFATAKVELSGTGGGGAGFLHVVIVAPEVVVDFDGNGNEDVFLKGSDSHTHEPGKAIVSFNWKENGSSFSTMADVTQNFSVNQHTVDLTIGDDAVPPKSLTASYTFDVVPINHVPGTLVMTYDAMGGDPATLLPTPPATPDFAQETVEFKLTDISPFTTNVMVRFLVQLDIQTGDTYQFFLNYGGSATLLLVNGNPTTGPIFLPVGQHIIDARFAVYTIADLPLEVQMAQGGGAAMPIDPTAISHDFTSFAPVINDMNPIEGSELGGNLVTLDGLGFFTLGQVSVQWGAITIPNSQLTVTPVSVELIAPAGMGIVTVKVNTPQGTSNSKQFTYSPGGPLPIKFTTRDLVPTITFPSTAAWGPDGKLYVGTTDGIIHVITVDDVYNVTNTTMINTIAALGNKHILGIAFNPFDPPAPVRIYVSHSELYADGGNCLTGMLVPYSGQVSILDAPSFNVVGLITQLPVSNHDHGINGLVFDRNGDLYVNVGGNTNAGIVHCNLGELPASPLSGGTLKAEISKLGFNGAISYVETSTGVPNDDQVSGDIVDVVAGVDMTVFGAGQRNPYDLVYTTWDMIYSTDNGPNASFGESSIASCVASGSQPTGPDELNLIEFGQYFGHSNCNRGRTDPRQNKWHDHIQSDIIGEFTQAITTFASSTNGIIEYRANTFNGAMRDNLVAQKYNNLTFRIELSDDKRTVVNNS